MGPRCPRPPSTQVILIRGILPSTLYHIYTILPPHTLPRLQVVLIEGILSGTLSYIFNTFGDGRKFSEIVAEARAKGYTEPDPRDDLNGTDVARKVRQAGDAKHHLP